jgi:acetylglutamate kinase
MKKETLVIKFGGNAMTNITVKTNVVKQIKEIHESDKHIVLVHGGGPFITKMLEISGLKSEFVDGLRKTDEESIKYIEMALKGEVNGEIVRLLNHYGSKAVGLSGKDGNTVIAKKRQHKLVGEVETKFVDLGLVGDSDSVDNTLINLLLENGYIPVIAPIALGPDGNNYNINADSFAGAIASSLNAEHYVLLTDVDGILKDKDDPSSLINEIRIDEAISEIGKVIQGGMIPKVESCLNALKNGAKNAHIMNGTKENSLLDKFVNNKNIGTKIIG